jgi:hypothetical protein
MLIKSRRMRWAGYMTGIWENRNTYMVLVGKPEGRGSLEGLGMEEIGSEGVNWINLSQDRDTWWNFSNMVINLWLAYSMGSFLNSWGDISFSRRTLPHGITVVKMTVPFYVFECDLIMMNVASSCKGYLIAVCFLIFCWLCIIMYHNNITNLIHFHFHKHFIVSYPVHVSGVKCPSSGGTTLAVFVWLCVLAGCKLWADGPQLAPSQHTPPHTNC